jgi:ferredoxin--NADP+ reductase
LPTEIPANVYDGLKSNSVTDVHVFGRRGPMQVKFTPLELRELGEMTDVDIVVYEEDFDYDEASKAAIGSNKQIMVLDRIFTKWRSAEKGTASRRLHLHFYAGPVEVLGTDRVERFRYERTKPDGEGGVVGTGEFREVAVQSVYRAVGYFGSPLDGIPFDDRRGVVPNREGQVIDDNHEQVYGVYATGWIKRGPVGLIGHTKSDAMETIKNVMNDQANWWSPEHPDEQAVIDLLKSRGVDYTNLQGWQLLDAHEIALGEPEGRARVKLVDRDGMIAASTTIDSH